VGRDGRTGLPRPEEGTVLGVWRGVGGTRLPRITYRVEEQVGRLVGFYEVESWILHPTDVYYYLLLLLYVYHGFYEGESCGPGGPGGPGTVPRSARVPPLSFRDPPTPRYPDQR
jgi:hypothetical protein